MNLQDNLLNSVHIRREVGRLILLLQSNIEKIQCRLVKADHIIKNLERNLTNFASKLDHEEDEEDEEDGSTSSEEQCDEDETHAQIHNPLPVKIGKRVVWLIGDDEPALGTVKWVGLLSDGLVAGVEFDDPIGNCDGRLEGKRLFKCDANHGRLVLLKQLILWKDFVA